MSASPKVTPRTMTAEREALHRQYCDMPTRAVFVELDREREAHRETTQKWSDAASAWLKQRDELVAALGGLRSIVPPGSRHQAIDAADSAIARVRGGAA